MPSDEFDEYVDEAIEQLPPEFRDKLDNVSIYVEDFPSPEQLYKLQMRQGHTLLGLYEGIPQTKRGGSYGVGGTMPDKITLFRYSILRVVNTKEDIIKQIYDTLYHEIGHHFGMSEEELRRLEKHR